MSEAALSATAFRWLTAGEWRAYPGRAISAAAAIAIGVALGFAVHLINASALSEFSRAVSAVSGDADLQVRAATAAGFDEGLYPRLARLPGVAAASPVVELTARLDGAGPTPVTVLGLDLLRAARATPNLVVTSGEGRLDTGGLLGGETIFLSNSALAASGRKLGDSVVVRAGGRSASFRIGGLLPGAEEGRRVAVIDIAAAQWRLATLGRLQRIDLDAAEGADLAQVRKAVAAALPPGVQIVSAQSEAKRTDALSRAYRVNLDMLALMALLTGGFLVFSAQSLSVARRRTQFALLRVLGATRREVLRQVFAEGLAVGLIGSLAGLGLGLGFAAGALSLVGGDLGGGYFAGGGRPSLVFAPGAAATFLALGLAAALLGSLLPAREAAEAPPAASLKNLGDEVDPRRRTRVWPALALLAAGAGAALLPAVGELPLFGYLSVGLLLAGGVAAMPWLARIVLAPLHRWPDPAVPLDLAVQRLWGAPSQAGVALCGMVASTGLMIAMAVMVASFRGSVDDWLNQIIPPGLALSSPPGSGAGLDPGLQRAILATPGVARATFQRTLELSLAPERPPIVLLARRAPGETLPLTGPQRPVSPGATPAWVSEPAAWIYGYKPGDRLRLPIQPGRPPAELVVAGVWRDYARQQGAIALADADFTRLTGDATRSDAAVELEPGAAPNAVTRALRRTLAAAGRTDIRINDTARVRETALRIFDRSFAITYLLEAVAILVGVAGVAATVSAQTLARTKEFGMLRHLGVLKREIAAMLTIEGLLLGVLGAVAGLGLGVIISQVLIQVINPQSFHWTMQTRLPLGLLAGVGAALVAAAGGTALVAGRRALSSDAVRAVREDW